MGPLTRRGQKSTVCCRVGEGSLHSVSLFEEQGHKEESNCLRSYPSGRCSRPNWVRGLTVDTALSPLERSVTILLDGFCAFWRLALQPIRKIFCFQPPIGSRIVTEAVDKLDGMTQENQRNGKRLPVRLPYSLVVSDDGNTLTIQAESINISKSGMRVKTDSQLYPGQTVEVILLEGAPHPVVARVVWVGQSGDPNQFEFGLEYLARPTQPV